MEARIEWGGYLYVKLGKRMYCKEYSFWGYECFPLRNDYRNKNNDAKWLFEKEKDNNIANKKNKGYPVLFINEKQIKKIKKGEWS